MNEVKMKFIVIFLCVSLIGMTGIATSAKAITFDLADDFSLASNPNGVWTYGAYTGGLDPTTFAAFSGSETGVLGSLDIWRDATDPNVIKNTGATFTTAGSGQITFHADRVTLGPYLGPAVARFTAPTAGPFQVDASFATVQLGNTAPNAYVFGGTTLLDSLGTVPAFSTTVGYSQQISLLTGDTIDFVVWGENRNNKTTEVSATIGQPIPEPATIALLGIGLAGLAGGAARKKLKKKADVKS